MKYLYKYPQAAFPYADLVETSRNAEPAGIRIRTARYRRLRRGSLLRRLRGVCQGLRRRHSDSDHGPQPRTGGGRDCTCCRRCGSAMNGRGIGDVVETFASSKSTGVGEGESIPGLASGGYSCDGDAPLLFTENETNTQRLFGVANRTPYVKDGINECVVHGQSGGRESRPRKGRKSRPIIRGTVKPGEPWVIRVRLSDKAERSPSARSSTTSMKARRREADEFYAALIPSSLNADQANVMRQALAGMLWSKQFYHYDVDKWLEERGSDPFKRESQARAAQRQLAPHVQRRRDLHAGQVGISLVRGVGPRLPRHGADARRSGFRQAAAQADAPRTLHASQRTDSGLRMELRRRQSAGACLVHHLHLSPGKGGERAKETRNGSRAVSRSCCSTSPGGSIARIASAAMSSKAASWASTTSACSIAVRRCRPAATWNRPTAPRGWRCSARTCWRSRPNWR